MTMPKCNINNNSNNNNNNMMLLSPNSSLLGIRSSFQFLTLFLIALVISILFLTQQQNQVGSSGRGSASSPPPDYPTEGSRRAEVIAASDYHERNEIVVDKEHNQNGSGRGSISAPPPEYPAEVTVVDGQKNLPGPGPGPRCDVFSGKWVFDGENYPLYKERECSFMSDQLACQKYGRQDLRYQSWRWQPHHCDLPRFNGTALLERLRNKRLMYVGDSLNRGQWISMICLVDGTLPPSQKSMTVNGSLSIFKAIEYNATIEFYWAPMLVESNSDDPILHRLPERIVRTQAIEKHARFWTDADVLVFDTYLWWRRPLMKVLWGSFESGDGIYKEVEMLKGYEMALRTWSDWLEIHVNHSKTQVFWMSISPTHEMSEEWGGAKGSNCYNETQPIFKQDYSGSASDPNMMNIVNFEIDRLSKKGVNIQLLNITQLSDYRKDAHPAVNRKYWDPITKEQLINPTKFADCDHWCLPGVPDTWNEILYAYIFHYF